MPIVKSGSAETPIAIAGGLLAGLCGPAGCASVTADTGLLFPVGNASQGNVSITLACAPAKQTAFWLMDDKTGKPRDGSG